MKQRIQHRRRNQRVVRQPKKRAEMEKIKYFFFNKTE